VHRFSRNRTWVDKCSQKLCTISVLVWGVTQKLDSVILVALNNTLHEPRHKAMARPVLIWPTCYSDSSCVRWNTEVSLIKHTSVGCISSAFTQWPVRKIQFCCIIYVVEFVNHSFLICIQMHQFCWISCWSRRLAPLPWTGVTDFLGNVCNTAPVSSSCNLRGLELSWMERVVFEPSHQDTYESVILWSLFSGLRRDYTCVYADEIW
jgi:hypothetical protein